ncbi:MAG: ABC transporter ATP-binding protein [Coriobacteriales bacterium]|nr:ABC transporter ATP-binding protein [Coriobacteriales bacterium]
MSMLEVRNLTVRYGELTLLDDINFSLDEGERLMIVGPNGAGKSTLVNAITQGAPYSGEVLYDGVNVKKLKPVELAQKIGMLMQTHFVGYAFTVEEIVSLGRYAHSRGLLAAQTDEDIEAIGLALERCGLEELVRQSVLTLSGGELQRAFLAQVFAQNPRLLILDEPTNHLDLVYQKRIFELLDEWLITPGRAVLSVVHDLTLAQAFSSRVMLMNKGRIVALGPPQEALAPELLREVYGMDVNAWMRSLLAPWEQGEKS